MEWAQSSPDVSEDSYIPPQPAIIQYVPSTNVMQSPQPFIKQKSNFKESALALIRTCEQRKGMILNSQYLSKNLNMERRRFFDIINVLDAIDFCKKIDAESFLWKGPEHARRKILQMAINRGVFDSTKTLNDIFPDQKCISITQISIDLLLFFLALQVKRIDLKDLSFFLSRTNGREKTMICKLYQSAAIFELVGVIEKTNNIGEFAISNDFYYSYSADPTYVNSLLARPVKQSDFLSMRAEEFRNSHAKKKRIVHKKRTYTSFNESDDF